MPGDAFDELFDRDRLLGGLPAKRAGTVLFLIESRTARLVARSRQAMQRLVGREAAQRRELAYVEAFALGREPPRRPTVQDLERHAEEWAPLVARNPRVQAALARRMGERYRLARREVPGIRAALGLDDPQVAAAHLALYDQPLDSVYATRTTPRERLRWASARTATRVEGLSPFWTAYALTLTETVGSTIVALPIAVAAVGPLPAVGILVVLGLVNVLTVALMADALTRTRTMRFGDAYVGRVVTDLLGRTGAVVLTVGLVAICLLGMEADYIGVSSTLTSAFGVHELVWVVLMFAVELWYLRRGSIDATVTSALVVGAINILLILVLSGLAFAHLDPGNLSHVELPFVDGGGSDVTSLGLVFGVTFTAYFGHLSVSNCARVVLARDASGGSLLRGVVAAQLTAIVLYVVFVLAVTGAVSPGALADEAGTALAPLSDEAGTAVLALGGILVVLGMGMASIHSGLALFYLVQERLPARGPRVLILPRRGARILLESRGRGDRTRAVLTYVGLDRGSARFRIDVPPGRGTPGRGVEGTASGRWEPFARAPLEDLGAAGAELALTVLSATEHEARIELTSGMRLAYEGEWDTAGVGLTGVLESSEDEATTLAWIMRRPDAGIDEVAAHAEIDAAAAEARLDGLVGRGLLAERPRGNERRFAARAGWRRGGRLSPAVWDALKDGEEEPAPASPRLADGRAGAAGAWLRRVLSSDRGRVAAGVAPVVVVFAGAVWQSLAGEVSLAGVLSVLGVIVVALLAGVFPVLLNAAARNGGELLGWGYRVPAQRWVLVLVYVFSVGAVALHGAVLWDDLPRRVAAFAVVVLALVMTASMRRRGAFARRATIELRHDEDRGIASFRVLDAGRPASAGVVLDYADGRRVDARGTEGEIADFAGLRRATFTPAWNPDRRPAQLRVWAHRVTDEDESEPLAARLQRGDGAAPGAGRVAVDEDGVATVPVDGDGDVVTVVLAG
ncbi:hypothetical protein AB0L40_10605 [Patulibacter sp. NPDC049589]|uniref:hypothetical protein n=1 Tax=Patulibacter sp. NPDC049589 TaxID=3154731 RepID=UPI0034242C6A